MLKRNVLLSVVAVFLVGLLMTSAASLAQEEGGVLRVATIGEPPALDSCVTNADITTMIGQHIYQGLFAFDEQWGPVPLLAAGYDVEEDGTLVVIYLRHGVLFHNGKEMTAEDVIASLERYGEFGIRGAVTFGHVDYLASPDKYTVEVHLMDPFGPLPAMLALLNGGPIIVPKEVAESAGGEPIPPAQIIGTGPYRFIEWVPNRHIRLARFDDYKPAATPGARYAGNAVAFFDQIDFIPVPELGTRIAGVKAGDYDYAENISSDLYDNLVNDPDVQVVVKEPPAFTELWLNEAEGMMTNQKLRQAILVALDTEPILYAAFGPEALWVKDGAISPPGTVWYSTAGHENYSQADPERARQLAAEAGYTGEPIRYMTTTQYDQIYNQSLVVAEQLRAAGFNIDLQIYDWATLVSRRVQPSLWDCFLTTHGYVPDPALYNFISPNYPGWWDTAEKRALVDEMNGTLDFKIRYAAWEKLQALIYEQVPFINTGLSKRLEIASPRVANLNTASHPVSIYNYFWNVWFE